MKTNVIENPRVVPQPAAPAVPAPVWLKESVGISITGVTKTQLDTWTARLTKPGDKPANRGDLVTEMIRVLLDAGWVPGVAVIVRKARHQR